MPTTLNRLFQLQAGEGKIVLLLMTYYFFITAVAIIGRSVSSALFFSRVDNAEAIFPLMLIPVTLAAMATVSIYTRLAKRLSLVALLSITGLFSAVSLVTLQFFLTETWALIALYIWMDVLNIVMFFQFYIFAGTIFDTRQAKRTFGLLGVGGGIATILSGLALGPLMAFFGSSVLIIVTATFIALSVLMVWLSKGYMRPELQSPPTPKAQISAAPVSMGSYIKKILVVFSITILIATMVDYQYKVVASQHFSQISESALTGFFGTISAIGGVLQLIIRLFLVAPILSRFGILAGLIVLPVGLILGMSSLLLAPILLYPMFIGAGFLRITDQSLRLTLNETALELLWVPISAARKLAYKPFVNGTIPSLFQGIAGLLIFGVVNLSTYLTQDAPGQQTIVAIRIFGLIIFGLIAIWIPTAIRLRRGYVEELISSIEQRELVLDDLNLDLTDNTIIETVDRSLNSNDEVEQAFAMTLIEELPLNPWATTLNRIFHEGNFLLRQQVLKIAADYPQIISNDELLHIIQHEDNELVDEAIIAATKREIKDIIPALDRHLESQNPEFQAAAALAILTLNEGPIERAQDVLRDMIEDSDNHASNIGLSTLASLPREVASQVIHQATLRDLLHSRSTRARRIILEMVVNPGYYAQERPEDNDTILAIAYNLRRPSTQQEAQTALRNYPDAHVIEVLTTMLRDKSTAENLKTGIVNALQNYPTPTVIEQLVKALSNASNELYQAIIKCLVTLMRENPFPPDVQQQLKQEMLKITQDVYRRYQIISQIPDSERLLRDLLETEVRLILPALMMLSTIDKPNIQIEMIVESLEKGERQHRGNILEILDNVLSREERERIIPLFDQKSPQELAKLAQQYYPQQQPQANTVIAELAYNRDPWRALLGLDYYLRHRENYNTPIDWGRVRNSKYVREVIYRTIDANPNDHALEESIPEHRFPNLESWHSMYSTLEKTIILSHVDLFRDIQPKELFHIAQITTEEELSAGQTLFKAGDIGQDLYIIARGRIRIHRDDHTINTLSQGNLLGEMALFDELPRSASATAEEDCILFKINQEQFQTVMGTHQNIMRGMIRTLSLRLRQANESLMLNGKH